ncbi:Gfo/Idh/MocA family protein [Labrys wisconsinensis]|uniref:Dehydrogenase n=1 Tax=Labrys wisconsinensis TaxID=425677 RepID=A0ABU0J5L5_9HYPH|nr:Gfo/Idh/MocA family oxidoreductase [Labrys wisconsinensis]MDQ0469550.1 putative dehydrogenase [Labrys wisconsinensis]
MSKSEERPVRIGLVGAGAIMRLSHGPVITRSPDAELAAVFDRDLGRAEAIADEFGGRAFDDLEAMLDKGGVDAVVVATPNRFHGEGVIAAAAHGKHVLCEKPLALDIAESRRMVEACEAAGVVLQVGFNQRFWGQVQIAKALVDAGFIGKIHQMRSIYSEKSTAYPAATRYRYDLAQSGGATIIDLTIHRIDLARHLVGDFAGVFAELAHSEMAEAVDDNVWLLTRFAGGARGCLSGNRYSPNIGDGTDLYGTEGTIHIASETLNPFNAAPLAVYTEKSARDLPDVLREAHYPDAWWKGFDGGWITVKPPRRSPYEAQLKSFCDAIRAGRPADITGLDGLKAQEVVQAAYLSMRSGGWVDLPLAADAPFIVPTYA